MATLGQIFGQYTGGIKPDDRKVTGADFLSAIGSKKEPTLPASGIPWSEVRAPGQSTPQTQQTNFVRRDPTVVRQPVQSPVQTPTVQPSPVPTVADMYKNVNVPTIDAGEDRVLSRTLRELEKQAGERVDESSIREDVMSRYQQEIDAINNIYAEQLAQARQQGLGALGSTRAIQARSGLLGSDFASAQTANVEEQNRGIQRGIQAEQQAKISALMGEARASAASEIAEKRKAIQEGLQSYINFLGASQERRQNKLAGLAQSLIDQGIRPDEISPQQIQEIAKAYGVNEQDILSAYSAKERELAVSPEDFTLSEGQMRFAYNPATGQYETIAAGASKSGGSTLSAAQQTKADSINNVRRQLANYKQMIENSVSATGGNQFGADAAALQTAKASLEFAIANAVGTGALQAADRAVVQEIIPDPTTFTGAPGRWITGGKSGVLSRIQEAERIFEGAANSIGSGAGTPSSVAPSDASFAESWL